MDRKNYFNSVTHQVMDLGDLAGVLAEKCFDLEKLRQMVPEKVGEKIRRVILVGCGDSYSAAGAMQSAFRALSGIRKVNTPDIMDFCGFYTEDELTKSFRKEEVLVAAVSFSGLARRITEALKKAASLGVCSLLITGNPDSPGGKAADYVFDVKTPNGCNTPGLRSYYASMVGITALGAYLGLCSHAIGEEKFREAKRTVLSYTLDVMKDFDRIDERMFGEALRMKDLTKFEIIADWNEGYSAQFVEQKLIECGGVYCDHTTSEEFAHISLMYREPSTFGTIVMINRGDHSFSRMIDTMRGALGQHRPVLVVTDADPELFEVPPDTDASGGKAAVCRIAKAPVQWLSPLMDFVPGALLAGYHAAVNEKMFFGGRFDFRTQRWIAGE